MAELNTKISVSPFDQILAVSQKAVNESFRNLWVNDKTGILSKFADIDTDDGSSITGAALDYPRVMFTPSALDVQSVIYILVFKKGQISLANTSATGTVADPNDPTDPNQQPWIADISGWHIGIKVNITQQALGQKDPQHIQKASYAGVDPTNFRTQQLLVHLSAANFASLDDNTYKTFGAKNTDGTYVNHWDKLPDDTQSDLTALLGKYILSHSLGGQTILGQSLTKVVPNAGGTAATFQPTAMRYQTYPYIQSDGTWQPPSLDGNGILNTLLYTQTIGNPLPSVTYLPTDAGKSRGLWFNDANDLDTTHYGAFAIRSDFWWTNFILPKLRSFNAAMEGRIDNVEMGVHCSYDAAHITTTASIQPHYSCGTGFGGAPTNSAYDFKLTSDGGPAGAKTYSWSSHFTTNRNPNWSSDGGSQGAPGDRQWDWAVSGTEGKTAAELTTRNNHSLVITPGSNVIKISGTNEVFLWWNFTGVINPWTAITRYVATWSVDLTLSSVSDGGLQFTCVNRQHNVATPNFDTKFGGINAQIINLMDIGWTQLDTLENNIQNAAQGLEKFFFPGQGVFFFKNPRVGYENSLAVDLAYNGKFETVDVPGVPKRSTPPAKVTFTPGSSSSGASQST